MQHTRNNDKRPKTIIQVAVPAPLYGCFDYLQGGDNDQAGLQAGCRVQVPFGRQSRIGIILGTSDCTAVPAGKLKTVQSVFDIEPVLPDAILKLLKWAASYYQYPIGEVIQSALPVLLKKGKPVSTRGQTLWRSRVQDSDDAALLTRAPKQQQLYAYLQHHDEGLTEEQLNLQFENWRPAMKALVNKGLATTSVQSCLPAAIADTEPGPRLNAEQQAIVDNVRAEATGYRAHLVHGVTGSGKTEVYMSLAQQLLAAAQQVLVLVPEISLTPQLTDRFRKRLGVTTAVLHSGMNDSQRLCAWSSAAKGDAQLVIGTRSAVFAPMPQLGLIIVDEEHDGSYKQQDGFRYNARDLALVRAQQAGIPVILGSATPSLESLYNCYHGRYRLHTLTQRTRNSRQPSIKLVDLCKQKLQEGLSAELLAAINRHLHNDGQVLLFLNRRGYSPVLMCHDCGWTISCRRCDAHMTYHRNRHLLRCHHCGAETPVPGTCSDCGSNELISIGAGTERIEDFLKSLYPETHIERIDRDTTRRKGALHEKLEHARSGNARILVGTQMLSKGHDFPNVTLVGVLDTDQGLYSGDFRASEHLAQLVTQVAGRAGRAHKPGEVLIQTHHPDHPLLQTLLHEGYDGFAHAALSEREQAGFPPYRHLAMLRCEAVKADAASAFMESARELFTRFETKDVEVFGPLPAPMEKRAGRYRMQLILQSTQRKSLHLALQPWSQSLSSLKTGSKVRWSVDVDPYDTY
ncbi:MAG: primosomal protein N' [Gammaproteobacteria bacterium]|nr:primosomal protein N' [Gammaproteobacteria bacterium]